MSNIDIALQCARRGWPVFPCKADKSPLTVHGFKDASLDEAQIREWWTRWQNALVAISTGPAHLCVVDWDDVLTYKAWRAQHPEVMLTRIVVSPRCGVHSYYTTGDVIPSKTKAIKELPDTDIRATGGYAAYAQDGPPTAAMISSAM